MRGDEPVLKLADSAQSTPSCDPAPGRTYVFRAQGATSEEVISEQTSE